MNNKGQSLVLFICLIPILVVLFAYIFDSALIVSENIKLEDIAHTSLEYLFDGKSEDTVREYILKNDASIKIIELNVNDDNVSIHLQKIIDSYFGKTVGFDTYEINGKFNGYKKNNKVIIREG